VLLGFVEAKKKNSLCFDDVVSKYEDTLAKGGVNVEMLKSFGA
jgi:hypothetical protein